MSALQHEKEILTSDGLLIDDIHLCSRLFIELRYSHTRREGNKVAQGLPRYALHISDFFVWTENVPLQFFPVFQANLANFQ